LIFSSQGTTIDFITEIDCFISCAVPFPCSLSIIGYLSYVPDIRQLLIKSPNMPLRDELLSMDPQCLSLLVLAGILLTLIGKVYFISVVWSCYKFLTLQADGNEMKNSKNEKFILSFFVSPAY